MIVSKLRKINTLPGVRKMTNWAFNNYYRDNKIYKIMNGPLKGKKWHYRKGTSLWIPLGNYENETAGWLMEQFDENTTFFDVGANLGYFTLMSSFKINKGKIFAFEPVPKNIAILKKNLELNDVKNVQLIEKALSVKEGKAHFAVEENGANSHFEDIDLVHAKMNKEDVVEVNVTTLDIFCKENNVIPDVIKVDVEGAEVDVLKGATELLKQKKTKWLVSVHTDPLMKGTLQIFKDHGYRTENMHGLVNEILAFPV